MDLQPAGESENTETSPLSSLGNEEHASTLVINAGVDSETAEPAADQLQPGSLLRDRYLLKERIGTGGMGTVFKALDRHLAESGSGDATVAIKVLASHLSDNPDALKALQQEAVKGRSLAHPGIVRFFDLDRDGDLFFVVMEWLDGQSLADVLDAGLLANDLPRTFSIIRQIAEALHHAHERGIVHGDVKPGNILLLPDGTAKLLDFGVARVRQLDASLEVMPTA